MRVPNIISRHLRWVKSQHCNSPVIPWPGTHIEYSPPVATCLGRTQVFSCAHMSVSSVESASCGACGPLRPHIAL
jgi:hypothetical protein